MVDKIQPSIMPTRGGLLEVLGTHLAGARLSVDQSTLPLESNQPNQTTITVLENCQEDRLQLVELGEGVGSPVWLLLENVYGKTRFSFAYAGEQESTPI